MLTSKTTLRRISNRVGSHNEARLRRRRQGANEPAVEYYYGIVNLGRWVDPQMSVRRTTRRKVCEVRKKTGRLRTSQDRMEDSVARSRSELLEMIERGSWVRKRIAELSRQKMVVELRLRTQQCRELRLYLARYEPEQQPVVDAAALAEIRELIATLEGEFEHITQEVSGLQEDKVDLGLCVSDLEAKCVLITREFFKLQEEQVHPGHIITA